MGRTSDARERLLAAGHQLIWECSYGAVTVDAICERALVKKGSFYHFFDSKSDLALASIDAWWVERHAATKIVFSSEIAPLDRIRGYIDLVAQRQIKSFEAKGQVLGCPLLILGAEICTQDQPIRSRLLEILTALLGYFEQAIQDAQALGEVAEGDAARQARVLFSCYEGALTLARIENDVSRLYTLSSDVLLSLGTPPVRSRQRAVA